jgi:hypothetical protein
VPSMLKPFVGVAIALAALAALVGLRRVGWVARRGARLRSDACGVAGPGAGPRPNAYGVWGRGSFGGSSFFLRVVGVGLQIGQRWFEVCGFVCLSSTLIRTRISVQLICA